MLKISRSGFYEWRGRPPSNRDLEDAYLANTIVDTHHMSRCSYGSPRVQAELRLGLGVRVGRKRVARLLRLTGRRGISHRHKRRGRRPDPAVYRDFVQRKFVAAAPDLLWHTGGDGPAYVGGLVRIIGVDSYELNADPDQGDIACD